MTVHPVPPGSPPPARGRRPLWLRALVSMAALIAVLYVIEAVDAATAYSLDRYGIEPRDVDGLPGVVVSPFLHADWGHLAANTGPLFVLGFLVVLSGRFLAATAIVWLCSGLGVWLIAPPHTVTVGASGIIFGWLTFLLVRGIVNRDLVQILVGVVVFLVYGTLLFGVLPGAAFVSWQGHLCGAVGGVLAAWLLRRRKLSPPPATPSFPQYPGAAA